MSVSEDSKTALTSPYVADEALQQALADLGDAHSTPEIAGQLQTAIQGIMAAGTSDIDVIAELAVAEIVLASNGQIRPGGGRSANAHA